MKKPTVDYRNFRFSKLTTPEFSHLLLLLGWVGYFLLYFLTENLIPYEKCQPIHSRLDDMIPFCEFFVVPYVGWYLLIVVTLVYFALYNVKGFRSFQIFILVTQVAAMDIYIIFPNRQDLRPDLNELGRSNVFTELVSLLYTADTSTNVCPSLHVAYSIGIASAWLKEKNVSPYFKAFIVIFCVLVCLSTAFIKQHSVLDGFAAIAVCVLAECIAYKAYWKKVIKKPI